MNEELNIETTRNDENEVKVVMETITDRSQVINRLQEIVNDISLSSKVELEHLKQGFYKLLHTEQEAKKAEFVANGGSPSATQGPRSGQGRPRWCGDISPGLLCC